MTDNDKHLLQAAREARPMDWAEVGQSADKADSPEVAREISRIASFLYHIDEYNGGYQ